MYPYLKTLPLSAAQKQLITTQGYENAPTLYMICKATPIAVKQWLNLSSLDALETALWNLMTPGEQTEVQAELDELKNM